MALALILSATAISMTCVGAAAFLLWHERKGWGWFLLVAFLVAATSTSVKIIPDDSLVKGESTKPAPVRIIVA